MAEKGEEDERGGQELEKGGGFVLDKQKGPDIAVHCKEKMPKI
jgi:hypothetical protein